MNILLLVIGFFAFLFLLTIASDTTSTAVKVACVVTLVLAFFSPFLAALAFCATLLMYAEFD